MLSVVVSLSEPRKYRCALERRCSLRSSPCDTSCTSSNDRAGDTRISQVAADRMRPGQRNASRHSLLDQTSMVISRPTRAAAADGFHHGGDPAHDVHERVHWNSSDRSFSHDGRDCVACVVRRDVFRLYNAFLKVLLQSVFRQRRVRVDAGRQTSLQSQQVVIYGALQ